jgi:sulfite reductase alpha subunit-like flavoprotein
MLVWTAGREHMGVASTFLANRKPGEPVRVFVKVRII